MSMLLAVVSPLVAALFSIHSAIRTSRTSSQRFRTSTSSACIFQPVLSVLKTDS